MYTLYQRDFNGDPFISEQFGLIYEAVVAFKASDYIHVQLVKDSTGAILMEKRGEDIIWNVLQEEIP